MLYLQYAQLLVGEVRPDLAEVGHDYEPVWDGQKNHVGRLQQARDAQHLETVERLAVSEKKEKKEIKVSDEDLKPATENLKPVHAKVFT